MSPRKVIVVSLMFFSAVTQAQVWWDFGIRGGVSSGFLINSEILDNSQYPHQWTFGNFFTGRIGTNFGDHSIISVEYGRTNTSQKWYFGGNGNSFYRTLNWSTNDLYVLYRHIGESGSFFEIGPKFSTVASATQSLSGNIPQSAFTEENVLNMYSEKYTSAVFGFGSYIAGTENLSFILSFRIEYGIQDLFSDNANNINFPIEFNGEASNASSHPLLLQVGLEINYDIGYLVSPRCADRYKFVTF